MAWWTNELLKMPEPFTNGTVSYLKFLGKARYDPGGEYLQGAMKYQGWGLGGCSTAFLWGWGYIPISAANKESLASFANALEAAVQQHSYNPHMVLCQVPEDQGGDWFRFFVHTVYPGIEPVHTYPNRAHSSTTQRLYHFDTDLLFDWRNNYVREEHARKNQLAAAPNVGKQSDGGKGTIITRDKFDAAALKALPADAYFAK